MLTFLHAPALPSSLLIMPELRSVFYPMGFPLEIETNSPDVLAAAKGVWARYPRLSEGAPVRLRVTVAAAGMETIPPFDSSRLVFDGEWMTVGKQSGAGYNQSRGNLAQGWCDVGIVADGALDTDCIRYHILEPLAYLLLAPRHYAFVHAACVALNGRAMVLCGDAGAGKTCLSFACVRKGWTFLSGDATHLLHRSAEFSVAGRPYTIRFRESARDLFPELKAWPVAPRPNQKLSIEADTAKLNVLTALRARASHIVFLQRLAQGAARIDPVSVDETLRRLDESVFFGDESIRANQRITLRHFASLPSVRLTYSDLHDGEAALRGLIPDGI